MQGNLGSAGRFCSGSRPRVQWQAGGREGRLSWRWLPHSHVWCRLGKSQQGLVRLDLHVVSPAGRLPDSPAQARRLRAPKNTCHGREPGGSCTTFCVPALEVSRRALLHLLTRLDEAVTKTLAPCKEDIDSTSWWKSSKNRRDQK